MAAVKPKPHWKVQTVAANAAAASSLTSELHDTHAARIALLLLPYYFFITCFTKKGQFVSQASQDHFEAGFGNPSASCVFFYYMLYYKGTISVPSKPRPL